MKLTYRGVEYNYNPVNIETINGVANGKITGKYRGLDWRFRNGSKNLTLLPTKNLTYRGVAYNKGEVISNHIEVIDSPNTVPIFSTEQKARFLMFSRTKDIKKRQQVMLSRTASSLGLDIDNYWNHIQGKVHSTFRNDYDRLGAAMS